MQFRTELQLSTPLAHISYKDPILLLGSCFAENIGQVLQDLKYQVCINPHGIIYNPEVLAHIIAAAIDQTSNSNKVVEHPEGGYIHWLAHSRLSAHTSNEASDNFTKASALLRNRIRQCQYLIITMGTAFYYEHQEYGMVANCHKYPKGEFKKKMSTNSTIEKCYQSLIAQIRDINPEIKILLTVSPVRHIRDGIIENNRSKAQLISAVHNICENEKVTYVPSYELLIDDLRDYRYYNHDMVHPSSQAISYIWEKLSPNLLSKSEDSLRDKIKKIINAAAHRPFNESSEKHQQFCQKQLDIINELNSNLSDIDLSREQLIFQKQLK